LKTYTTLYDAMQILQKVGRIWKAKGETRVLVSIY